MSELPRSWGKLLLKPEYALLLPSAASYYRFKFREVTDMSNKKPGKVGQDDKPEAVRFMYFSKAQLAEAFGISIQTLSRRLGDIPAAGRRNGGVTYLIRDVATLVDVRKSPADGPDFGEDDEKFETDPEKMKPADAQKYWQSQDLRQAAEIKARRNAVEAGQLLQAQDVERAIAEAFKTIVLTLDTLPDQFERDGIVSSADIERVIEIVDNSRQQLAVDLGKLSNVVQRVADGEIEDVDDDQLE